MPPAPAGEAAPASMTRRRRREPRRAAQTVVYHALLVVAGGAAVHPRAAPPLADLAFVTGPVCPPPLPVGVRHRLPAVCYWRRSFASYSAGCSYPAIQVYAAAAATTPEAMPMKEQDLVSVAGATGKVCSQTVRELIKLGFLAHAAVPGKQKASFRACSGWSWGKGAAPLVRGREACRLLLHVICL